MNVTERATVSSLNIEKIEKTVTMKTVYFF